MPFPTQAANALIMYSNDWIVFEFTDLQDKNSLTLDWHSISEWGMVHVALSYAYQACQYGINVQLQQMEAWIAHDARLKIVDSVMTLILPWMYV